MASLKDISKICGVSVATVSKALNDHKDIGEETKANIRRVAKEMGYSPNLSARALKTNRTYGIGVLFADEARSGLTHDYFSSVLDSFKRTAEKSGYDITFINSCKNRPDRMSYLEHSRYRGFDGVVLACIDFADPEVIELVQSSIPVVTIDYLFNNRIAIMSDNVTGMKELLEYIYSRGHRKIAYIHGAMSAVTSGRLSSFYRTPWYLVFLAGAGYAAIYYTVFRVLIRKLNLKTPGREDEEIAVATTLTREERPYQIIEAVGGFDNIEDVDACATRLRLALVDDKKVNEKRLKELGAAGLVKLGDGGVQVIFGGKSQILRDEIKTVMSRPRPTEMTVACAN